MATLGKNERLKSRKELERLFREGKKLVVPPLRVLYRVEAGNGVLRLGVGASTKLFRKAVERNRVKRLLREGWRLQKETLQKQVKEQKQAVVVFISYTGREMPEAKQVFTKMKTVIEKLIENT